MPPKDWYEPLELPGMLTLFGVMICLFGWNAEKGGKSAPWKWLGIALLIIGLWVGFPYFSHMIGGSPEDVIYRAGMPSIRRFSYAHYLAFFMPLLALIVCGILQFVKRPAAVPSADQ